MYGNLKTPLPVFLRMGTLRNSIFGDSAHGETSFSIRHSGTSLRTGTSKAPEFLRRGNSETPFLEFLRTGCARKPRSL